MRLKVIDVENDIHLESVLLFSEDKPEDYVFSHLLSLVSDKNGFVDLYQDLPDVVRISERSCVFQNSSLDLTSIEEGIDYEG